MDENGKGSRVEDRSIWSVEYAAAHLPELIDRARREGPQVVTANGRASAVVSAVDAEAVREPSQRTGLDFVAIFRNPLLWEEPEVVFERSPDLPREIEW